MILIKKLSILAATASLTALFISTSSFAVELTGAGSTFVYPVVSKWADAYAKKTGNHINYQSIGSGGGIKQIMARTVEFGASDDPLKPEELQQNQLIQFPDIIGGVIPTVNIPGIRPGQVKLTGQVLADIFQAKITKWNDPAIQKLNPSLKLPNSTIVVVHRADGSGTTFLFTDYLSKVSHSWSSSIGAGKAVNWASGVGAKGNEGVANMVKTVSNSIGYIEYAYVKQNKMAYVLMENKAGFFVAPNQEAFKAAADGAPWATTPGMAVNLNDRPGVHSWPITGPSFAILPLNPVDKAKGRAAADFFSWSLTNGAGMASSLDYVPLPASVVKVINQNLSKLPY